MTAKRRRKPYMPDDDLGKKMWMENFIKRLERDPKRYGFDDPRMFEYIQRTIRNFIKAVNVVSNPAQRSPHATLVKNQARAEAVPMCREIAMRLKWDPTLSDEEKIALGVNIDEALPERAKLPEGVLPGTLGYPELAVVSSPNGGHVIRFRDPNAGKSKGKPRGVSHFLLYGAIGPKPDMCVTHARLLYPYTKSPIEIMYPRSCGLEGLYVTYYGRWLTTRGELSPWSRPVSKMIGEAQVSLRDCAFAHLFGKKGFIDAVPELPEGVVRGALAQIEGAETSYAFVESKIAGELPQAGSFAGDGVANELAALGQRMLEAAMPKMLDAG